MSFSLYFISIIIASLLSLCMSLIVGAYLSISNGRTTAVICIWLRWYLNQLATRLSLKEASSTLLDQFHYNFVLNKLAYRKDAGVTVLRISQHAALFLSIFILVALLFRRTQKKDFGHKYPLKSQLSLRDRCQKRKNQHYLLFWLDLAVRQPTESLWCFFQGLHAC